MKLLTGNANRPLANDISKSLGKPLTQCSVRRFADQEIFVEVEENVRGQDVFFIQSTSSPVNDHLMELLIAMDALRRGSANILRLSFPTLVMRAKIGNLHRVHLFRPSWLQT